MNEHPPSTNILNLMRSMRWEENLNTNQSKQKIFVYIELRGLVMKTKRNQKKKKDWNSQGWWSYGILSTRKPKVCAQRQRAVIDWFKKNDSRENETEHSTPRTKIMVWKNANHKVIKFGKHSFSLILTIRRILPRRYGQRKYENKLRESIGYLVF